MTQGDVIGTVTGVGPLAPFVPPLPYDAEIEYLGSTGTQYIDTGLYGEMDLDFEITAQITRNNNYQNILGDRESSTSRRFSLMVDARNAPTVGGYFNSGNSNQVSFPTTYAITNSLTYKKNGLNVYVNNNLIGALASQTFTTPYTVLLFGCRNNGVLTNSMVGRIEKCKFSKGATLIQDLICVRIGQVGYMYDKITHQLHGNAGTGAFTLGPDI